MSEQFKEVIDLLKKGEGGKAFHELGKQLGHHGGGVTAQDDGPTDGTGEGDGSGGNGPGPKKP